MTTPLYTTFKKRIDDTTEKLIREQVTPWSFFNAGPPFRIRYFNKKQIAYDGVRFEGSPRKVFWSRYIEPFLEDHCITEIRDSVSMASEREIDFRMLAPEIQGLLTASFTKVYRNMAEVDRRLRGKGFPDQVKLRNVEQEINLMNEFLEERIRAELAMWRPKSSFQKRHEKKPKQVKTSFSTYKIKDVMGQGGSGMVYKGEDEQGGLCAIKILNSNVATKEKMKRFKNEYIFCSRNKHKNIITVFDHGLINEAPFFVMPLYDNSLRDCIGSLELKQILGIFYQILDGVEAAHKLGVIHRDLKPENILIGNNGSDVIVTDFGIAAFAEEGLYTEVETKDGTRLANFRYAAPEQRSRGKTIDKRTDIYSLGLILNELFTAETPHGTSYKTIESISDEHAYLDGLVKKMLAQDPASRFSNIDDLKKELLARSEELITRQKISQLESTIIPSTEVDDILITDPIKIINVDWNNDVLTIKLNHPVNSDWIWSLKNMGNHASVWGSGPEKFDFNGQFATIDASSIDAKSIIDFFKMWLPQVNRVYANKVKEDLVRKELRQREELQKQINKEKERADVLKSIKF